MRRVIFLAAPALVLLGILTPLLSGQDAPKQPGAAPQAWEYRVLLMTDVVQGAQDDEQQIQALQNKFNELGRDGWEFSQIHLSVAVFKRPK